MQTAIRRLKSSTPLFRSASRLSVRRTYVTASGSPRQTKQRIGLLFVGTAALSATAGYYLAGSGTEKPGSWASATDLENTRYGTPKDFRKAIEELKATFPEPGVVSDDPVVVAPYGFSQNDYHPGESTCSPYIWRVLMNGELSLESHRCCSP